MKLANQIAASFVLVLALVLGMATVAGVGLSRIDSAGQALVQSEFPAAHAIAEIDVARIDAARAYWALSNRRVALDQRDALFLEFDRSMARLQEAMANYDQLADSPEETSRWTELKGSLTAWSGLAKRTVAMQRDRQALLRGGHALDDPQVADLDARAFKALGETGRAYEELPPRVSASLAVATRHIEMEAHRSQAAYSTAQTLLWTAALSVALLMIALGAILARSIRRTVRALVVESARLTEAVEAGKLDERGAPEQVGPEFRPVVAGMNRTMEAFVGPVRVAAAHVSRISRGDIPSPITARYAGEFEALKEALNRCAAVQAELVSEMNRMTAAQAAGDLDAFIEEGRFEGAYRAMAQGVNESTRMLIRTTLDGLTVLSSYGEGDFAAVMRPLPGKQVVMNETFDRIRASLMAVAAEVQALTGAAREGQLARRADASRLKGDWRALVEGVNATLAAVVGPLDEAARCVEQLSRGEIPPRVTTARAGDFARLRDNLNTCIDAVSRLVTDTGGLLEAALAGRLAARADPAQHQGDFRKIVEGVNRTLDAVMGPVQEAARTLDRLAQRDLRARVEGQYPGDHARIKDAVNATAQALQGALGQVASAVGQVSSAATQIASSSQAVASGASEQAAALVETGTSLESVADMSKRSSEHAHQANQLAQGAKAAAAAGTAAVELLQGTMVRIRSSADGTSQIIKDVSEIAFQTNLLALNAAVEAARAGEAGRGFAVVAEEVRSLALRAKEAANRTEELIRQSVVQAGEGEGAARQVSGKLAEIAQAVSQVGDLVHEIAAGAAEQASGIAQVNRAVAEMDKVTQQNAASAEQSSSAAAELSAQSEELAAMVGSFQLDQGGGRGDRPSGRLPVRGAASRDDASPPDGDPSRDF